MTDCLRARGPRQQTKLKTARGVGGGGGGGDRNNGHRPQNKRLGKGRGVERKGGGGGVEGSGRQRREGGGGQYERAQGPSCMTMTFPPQHDEDLSTAEVNQHVL